MKSTIKESAKKIEDYLEAQSISIDIYEDEENEWVLDFPRENENYILNDEEIIEFSEEIESLEFNKSYSRTKNKIQFPFLLTDSLDVLLEKLNFEFENTDYKILIKDYPLLIGIANVAQNLYSKYAPPLTTYHCVEIINKSKDELSVDEALKLVKSFILEFNQATNMIIELTELHDFDSDYYGYVDDEDDDLEVESNPIEISELINFNDAIDFYLKAQSTIDGEIKFLYYYKIVEYFSPKVAKLKSYDILSKKLESIKYKSAKSEDLDSIMEIAEAFRKSKSDSELAKTVLSSGIDIVSLFPLLPESVQKLIGKDCGININSINYNLSADKLDTILNVLGKILYSTRNSIVHAKSNYNSNSYECKFADLDQLNTFLCKATYQVFKWNDNLPKNLK